MIKESTASAFVLRRAAGRPVQVALILHPRWEEWLPPGGHVEVDEHPAEAAVREIWEETGYVADLLPGPMLALPAGFPHQAVAAPWWIVEMRAGADNHTPQRHVHIDHVFLAWAVGEPVREPGHRVRWFDAVELAQEPGIAEDSRLQAKQLMELIDAGQVQLPA